MRAEAAQPRTLTLALTSGFLAGQIAGLVLVIVSLAQRGVDFLAYWPTSGQAWALVGRSLGLYPLLAGLLGLLLAGILHPLLPRRWQAAPFAAVAGIWTAWITFAHLSAWWQIDVLVGMPLADSTRTQAAFRHAVLALFGGVGVGALCLVPGRRWVNRFHRFAGAALLASLSCLMAGEFVISSLAAKARETSRDQPSQVVVVGLDGMTLRVLSPLLRSGEMPTFRRLIETGAWGTFLTYGTASSPQVWTTMATGKRVRDHGIDDFVKAEGQGYRATAMKSSDRKVEALWNILGSFGHRVAIVDWQVTYPPEEVNGYMVSRLKLDRDRRTHPPELSTELEGQWSEAPADAKSAKHAPELRRALLLWNIDRVFEAAKYLLEKEQLDFVALYDHSIDGVEHRSWKHYEPTAFDPEIWDVDPETLAELGSLVPDVYRHADRRLGELLEHVDDDALILVVSDHGQLAARAPRVRLRLDLILERLGYSQLLPSNGGRDRVDTSKSRAYTLVETPWRPVMRVNLNVRGRETRGVVEPVAADALARRLADDLEDIRFTDGDPLFTQIERQRITTSRRAGADLRLTLSRHARSIDSASRELRLGDRTVALRELQDINSDISGEHDHQGVFFATGPGVAPGYVGSKVLPTAFHDLFWHLTDKIDALDKLLPVMRRLGLVGKASTLDLTPIVLHALGLPVARDMAGRVPAEIFQGLPHVQWLDTYEGLDTPRASEDDPASDEELMRQLRALGYVG